MGSLSPSLIFFHRLVLIMSSCGSVASGYATSSHATSGSGVKYDDGASPTYASKVRSVSFENNVADAAENDIDIGNNGDISDNIANSNSNSNSNENRMGDGKSKIKDWSEQMEMKREEREEE